MRKNISKPGRSLLQKILSIKAEPVTLMYYAITKIAETYKLSNGEVMSILMNFRADVHDNALGSKFERIIDFKEVEDLLNK